MDIAKKLGLSAGIVLMTIILTLIFVLRKKYFDIITNPATHCHNDWKCWKPKTTGTGTGAGSSIPDIPTDVTASNINSKWSDIKTSIQDANGLNAGLTNARCNLRNLPDFNSAASGASIGNTTGSTLCPTN